MHVLRAQSKGFPLLAYAYIDRHDEIAAALIHLYL